MAPLLDTAHHPHSKSLGFGVRKRWSKSEIFRLLICRLWVSYPTSLNFPFLYIYEMEIFLFPGLIWYLLLCVKVLEHGHPSINVTSLSILPCPGHDPDVPRLGLYKWLRFLWTSCWFWLELWCWWVIPGYIFGKPQALRLPSQCHGKGKPSGFSNAKLNIPH